MESAEFGASHIRKASVKSVRVVSSRKVTQQSPIISQDSHEGECGPYKAKRGTADFREECVWVLIYTHAGDCFTFPSSQNTAEAKTKRRPIRGGLPGSGGLMLLQLRMEFSQCCNMFTRVLIVDPEM